MTSRGRVRPGLERAGGKQSREEEEEEEEGKVEGREGKVGGRGGEVSTSPDGPGGAPNLTFTRTQGGEREVPAGRAYSSAADRQTHSDSDNPSSSC